MNSIIWVFTIFTFFIVSINGQNLNTTRLTNDFMSLGTYLAGYIYENFLAGNQTNLAIFGLRPSDYNVSISQKKICTIFKFKIIDFLLIVADNS